MIVFAIFRIICIILHQAEKKLCFVLVVNIMIREWLVLVVLVLFIAGCGGEDCYGNFLFETNKLTTKKQTSERCQRCKKTTCSRCIINTTNNFCELCLNQSSSMKRLLFFLFFFFFLNLVTKKLILTSNTNTHTPCTIIGLETKEKEIIWKSQLNLEKRKLFNFLWLIIQQVGL